MNKNKLEFRKIYETFQPKILKYLTRLVGKHESEDLTQVTFLKVNQGLKNFRGDSQLSTWIYRIATNTAFDKLRSSHRKNNTIEESKKIKVEQTYEQKIIKKEMNECIRNFVEDLPRNYQAVLLLSELEELKNNQIAKILGLTYETVKVRLHRAKAKLKKELETHCCFYRDELNRLACDLKSAFSKS